MLLEQDLECPKKKEMITGNNAGYLFIQLDKHGPIS